MMLSSYTPSIWIGMDRLTALAIKQAKPKNKPYRMFDGAGLYLDVRPNGSKYWRKKYRYAGKEKLLSIGTYPAITLKEAREACLLAQKDLQQNIDPSADLKGALQSVKVKHHPAITDPKGVGKLMLAIETYQGSPAVMAALKLSPLFFCRPGELRHMEWAEIDWDKKRWEIPEEKMKTREPLIVPLCTQAITILKHLQVITGRGKYVFPSARSASRPMSENAVRVALRTLGYSNEEMTPHGFRAIARTLLDEKLGYSFELIEHQLAHAVRDATGRAYNRTKHLKQRHEMMQSWAEYLEKRKAQLIETPSA